MARKKGGGGKGRQRAQQRAQYDELDKYPVMPPHAFARIVRDKRTLNIIYQIIEPPMTKKEQEQREEIMDIFIRSLTANIEEIDGNPEAYLRTAMDKVIKSYGMKITKKSKSKLFYYIRRDLIGYGQMDVLMNDANVEDISLDGTGVPIFAYHRKFESVETTCVWDTDEALESYVIKLAQRCGKHISVADPLLDATLMDGSRIVMKLGREVSTRGSAFCIRRFKDDPFSPADIVAFRTMSSLMVAYLWIAFQNEVPMLFVGGTASGKTTTLNAMCIFIPWQMKIVSIESTREVNIPQPNWVPGLTRQGFGGESSEGEIGEFELLKAALRERPEYIIVGEIRGAEAYVLFQAMATVTAPIQRFTLTPFHPLFTDWKTNQSIFHVFCSLLLRPARFKFKPVSTDDVFDAPSRSSRLSVSIRIRWKSSPTKCSAGTFPQTISSSAGSPMSLRRSWSRSTSHKTKCVVS